MCDSLLSNSKDEVECPHQEGGSQSNNGGYREAPEDKWHKGQSTRKQYSHLSQVRVHSAIMKKHSNETNITVGVYAPKPLLKVIYLPYKAVEQEG